MGQLKDILAECLEADQCGDEEAADVLVGLGGAEFVYYETARNCLKRGWSVVPQLAGQKKPAIRWKPYQSRLPSQQELRQWFVKQWPEAGIAVVLGPISDLFVIDVDGEGAHQALVERLGRVPKAPKVRSGSGKPYRYHLFFKHPDLATKAKFTPWHPKLEFRGDRGIVILPPSRHKSGHRYQWARGRSPHEMPLPELPEAVLEELRRTPRCAATVLAKPGTRGRVNIDVTPGISVATQHFLMGLHHNATDWNGRIFRAACDLAGNGVSLKQAMSALLSAARPWNDTEEQTARRTIESAYSQPRAAARSFARTLSSATVTLSPQARRAAS